MLETVGHGIRRLLVADRIDGLVNRRVGFLVSHRLLVVLLAFSTRGLVAARPLPLFAARPQATTFLALPGRQVLLLVLHSPILKPDFHLFLG